ncbi:MAG: hypothetical protein AAFV88_09955 [Planctomycetota bacterium]
MNALIPFSHFRQFVGMSCLLLSLTAVQNAVAADPQLPDQTLQFSNNVTIDGWNRMRLSSHSISGASPGTIDIKFFDSNGIVNERIFKCAIIGRPCTGADKKFDVVGVNQTGTDEHRLQMKLVCRDGLNGLTTVKFSASTDHCGATTETEDDPCYEHENVDTQVVQQGPGGGPGI